ncbi:MAG: Gfo/Idh/MocA family oxidoreductase [Armatimonadetes bacterium]|nr:Gfo/Idh/MocA family oxidoreductase [Armatimonadota bacterium]
MSDKIRLGIIGTGQIAKSHIATYKDVPEAEIVAVCDIREDEARRVAEQNGVPNVFTDYHEMLKMDEIDAVDVCLHNRLHAPVTIDALKAGKNVYCEKPMASSYAEAQSMYDTAKQTGKKLHVQLATLYGPETRAAKRMIDSKLLGDLYYVKASHYRRRGRPFVDGYGTAQFVQQKTAAGGAMLDMAVYHISRIVYLLGNPDILTVSGSTYQKLDMYEDRRESSGYDVEELGMGIIRLAGGVTFFMEESWAIHSGGSEGDRIYGSKGGLCLDPFSYFTTIADMEMNGSFDLKSADWRWHACDDTTAGYDNSQRHWVWALLGRVPLLDTAGIALKTAQITEGIYLSSKLGREVAAGELGKM